MLIFLKSAALPASLKLNTLVSDGSGQTSFASHSGVDHPTAAVSPSSERRPTSNMKSILPPIPNGRKSPAAASPGFSPNISPNPGVTKGGK